MGNATILGFTEAELADLFLSWGIGLFMLLMLFIVGELAWRSKVGKTGAFVMYFVLAFGMLGFIVKSALQHFWSL